MRFGACYYPEHWPEERWPVDARLMKEAGLNLVRIGEFAWSKLEPRPGDYDFGWLDRILGILDQEGIQVVLGTPTATPPKWLMDRHHDLYMKDSKGIARGFGNRRHYCYNHPGYHAAAEGIVTLLAERYGSDPRIDAWQIDNEFGCNDTARCYCENCRKAFQDWLMVRYGDIDRLNESWGTVFWSQTYGGWDEIVLPGYTVFPLHNPGLELDYRRFSSDSVLRFQDRQIAVLRELAPSQPITHNMWYTMDEIDSYGLARHLDFVSWDIYPNLMFTDRPDHRETGLQHDLARGAKSAGYWVMEHQSGPPGGNILFPTPKPGELRRWTYQSLAHGADAIVYFRWRTCLFGAEQFWHGILPHDGSPGRRFDEVSRVGKELQRLSPRLEGSVVMAEAAIIRSHANSWVMEIQPQVIGHQQMEHLKTYYRYFADHHIPVDLISEEDDFSGYRLVILPHQMLSAPGLAERLKKYAEAGGTVVLDCRAGSKEWNNRMADAPLPGAYRDLLGIVITDYGVLRPGETREVATAAAASRQPLPHHQEEGFSATTWYDVIELETAEARAWFTEDYFAGSPAVTVNRTGSGQAYYIGMGMQPGLASDVLDAVCHSAGVKPIAGIQADREVELGIRIQDSGDGKPLRTLFAINHGEAPSWIELEHARYECLSEAWLEGRQELPANGVLIFAEEEGAAHG